ncbi:integrase [Sorangium sp. So ce1151]|uniref:integrase n=1 Tax=Sorangium sp. So ce1151 TaxID=3133332 RepID=UPI003F62B986
MSPSGDDRPRYDLESIFDIAELPHNTRRLYAAQWRQFAAWCAARGAVALPARPRLLVLYLAALARDGLAAATLKAALHAIAKAHQITGLPSSTEDPIVLHAKRRILRELPSDHRHVTPLTPALMRQILAPMGSELIDARDRALLLVGYAARLRRAELVALDVEDALLVGDAIELRVNDRRVAIASGRDVLLCPARALRAWVDAAALRTGALFLSINRWGRLGGRLPDRSVSEIVQGRARQAGLELKGLSGDSLHVGSADDRRLL